MQCSMKKYVNKAMMRETFVRDFYDDCRHDYIGTTYEKNLEDINYQKYRNTVLSKEYTLSIPDKKATTALTVYYTKHNYNCTCANHKPENKIVFLFGAKHNDGHMFGICTNCLLKLSLILLKYYKCGKTYVYDKYSPIRLDEAQGHKECYACRKTGKQYYRLKLNNHMIFLCKDCLDKFAEEILTSPTVKALFYDITHEFEKSKRERKKKHKK